MPVDPPPNIQTLFASGVISSPQILQCFTTPVPLLPAPGPGFGITIIQGNFVYKFGGTPYTVGGGNIVVQVAALGWNQLAEAGYWDQGADQIWQFNGQLSGKSALGGWANAAVRLTDSVGNPTLGNGTIKWSLAYTLSPM